MTRSEPALFSRRRGSELTSALVSVLILSTALLLAVQAYYQSSLALTRTQNRARALMVLESQAEVLRAAGAACLPPPGLHALPAETLRGLPGATGSFTVRPGVTPGLSTVSLRLEWPEKKGPRGQASLMFALSPHGLDP